MTNQGLTSGPLNKSDNPTNENRFLDYQATRHAPAHRHIPRRPAPDPAGYRIYRKLAPGPWFNSVGPEEYEQRYRTEILGTLDPQTVIQELQDLAPGMVPTLLCFEAPDGRSWCHRSIAAEWLAKALGKPVPEYGHEHLPQNEHPLLLPHLRAQVPLPLLANLPPPVSDDIVPYIGRVAAIDGKDWTVVAHDETNSGRAIIADCGNGTLTVGIETLRRYFSKA